MNTVIIIIGILFLNFYCSNAKSINEPVSENVQLFKSKSAELETKINKLNMDNIAASNNVKTNLTNKKLEYLEVLNNDDNYKNSNRYFRAPYYNGSISFNVEKAKARDQIDVCFKNNTIMTESEMKGLIFKRRDDVVKSIKKMKIDCFSERFPQPCILNNSKIIDRKIAEIQESANKLQIDIGKLREYYMEDCCKDVIQNYRMEI